MKKFSLRISRQFKTDFITVEIRSEAKTINAAKQEVFDEFSAIPLFADHQELLAGTSKESVEEEFLEEEQNDNVPVYKFTYYSEDKDKIVNVLVKGLEENRSRIMILYWDLQ